MTIRALRIRSAVVALASCLAATAVLAGCGGSSAGSTNLTKPNVTTCGIPYRFTVGTHTVSSGSCAGNFVEHPPSITIRAGERLSLLITGNRNGSHITPAFPVPKPTGSAVAITKVTGRTVWYQAKTPGRSHLTVKSEYCPIEPKKGVCSVLAVSVSPTGSAGNTGATAGNS